MKYLITGASGQLAGEFISFLPSDRTYAYPHKTLDITDEKSLKECIDYVKPDVIINCAAYNNVDLAEKEYDKALNINSYALVKIAQLSEKYKSFIVHFSTDYVFDGEKKSPYSEKDPPNPLNRYGISKLEGEKNLLSNYPRSVVFRVSWVYGMGRQNFIYKFLSWLKDKKEIRVSSDEVSVPTSTSFIVRNVMKALSCGIYGLWHLVPRGYVSRYDYASAISSFLSLDVKLIPAKQSDFNLPAKRPSFSAMDSSAFFSQISLQPDSWEVYLHNFLIKKPFSGVL